MVGQACNGKRATCPTCLKVYRCHDWHLTGKHRRVSPCSYKCALLQDGRRVEAEQAPQPKADYI